MASSRWFKTSKVLDNVYLTREEDFFEGNRSNIWLIKGPAKDVVIDTGLGVCNLRKHFEREGLLEPSTNQQREVLVICTHVHFDHSGGAHHFEQVFIHEQDRPGLLHGRQTETLNYVKPAHFYKQPYPGFSACHYKVPPTPCQGVRDGEVVDIGGGQSLQILHVPGHTKGSICIYYPAKRALFTGDFVYECGNGGGLLDWLPNSCVRDFSQSASSMIDWISDHSVDMVLPGHFRATDAVRTKQLLWEYIQAKDNCCGIGCASCMQCATWGFFLVGCFRCCPC